MTSKSKELLEAMRYYHEDLEEPTSEELDFAATLEAEYMDWFKATCLHQAQQHYREPINIPYSLEDNEPFFMRRDFDFALKQGYVEGFDAAMQAISDTNESDVLDAFNKVIPFIKEELADWYELSEDGGFEAPPEYQSARKTKRVVRQVLDGDQTLH